MLENNQILNALAVQSQRAGELASRLNVSRATAHRKLNELSREGKVIREGSGPHARWRCPAQAEAWLARHAAVVSTPSGRAGVVHCGLLSREAALLRVALEVAQETGRGHVHGLELLLSPARPGEDVAASNASHAAVSQVLALFKAQALGLGPSPQPGSRRAETREDFASEPTAPGRADSTEALLAAMVLVLKHADSGLHCPDAEIRAAAWVQPVAPPGGCSSDNLVLATLSMRTAHLCLAATRALRALESRDGHGLCLLADAGLLLRADGMPLGSADCEEWAVRLSDAARSAGCSPEGCMPEPRAALFDGLCSALSALPCVGGPLPFAVAELLACQSAPELS